MPKHPVAVFVCPKDEFVFKTNAYAIQCYKTEYDNPIIIPRIYTPDKKIAQSISEEVEVLVIGSPYKDKNGQFVNLNLYINNKVNILQQ